MPKGMTADDVFMLILVALCIGALWFSAAYDRNIFLFVFAATMTFFFVRLVQAYYRESKNE